MINWDNFETFTKSEMRVLLLDVADLVEEKLARIRLGVYSEGQDGNLQEVLEEIERILG